MSLPLDMCFRLHARPLLLQVKTTLPLAVHLCKTQQTQHAQEYFLLRLNNISYVNCHFLERIINTQFTFFFVANSCVRVPFLETTALQHKALHHISTRFPFYCLHIISHASCYFRLITFHFSSRYWLAKTQRVTSHIYCWCIREQNACHASRENLFRSKSIETRSSWCVGSLLRLQSIEICKFLMFLYVCAY